MQILREAESARLRASLRAMLPAVVTLVMLVGILMVLGTIFKSASEERASSGTLLASFAQIVLYVVLIGTAVWGATELESRNYADFRLNIDANWGLNFIIGTIISLIGIMASLWWANIRGFRNINFAAAGITGPNKPLVLGIVFAVFICYFLLGNIYEEVIYRRIMLGNFMEGLSARGISPKGTVILASTVSLLLFGMYHIPLRGDLVVVIDAALAGIPFALALGCHRTLHTPR